MRSRAASSALLLIIYIQIEGAAAFAVAAREFNTRLSLARPEGARKPPARCLRYSQTLVTVDTVYKHCIDRDRREDLRIGKEKSLSFPCCL